ncbi:hypothetical protein AB0F72_32290 [Actinoplanes sp. NPDC023936]|uniref:hypothetical protein n=1 Tax=Actinoplanes sp. NPDC023936 TaxID=3154910 RepID=UPI0033D794F3
MQQDAQVPARRSDIAELWAEVMSVPRAIRKAVGDHRSGAARRRRVLAHARPLFEGRSAFDAVLRGSHPAAALVRTRFRVLAGDAVRHELRADRFNAVAVTGMVIGFLVPLLAAPAMAESAAVEAKVFYGIAIYAGTLVVLGAVIAVGKMFPRAFLITCWLIPAATASLCFYLPDILRDTALPSAAAAPVLSRGDLGPIALSALAWSAVIVLGIVLFVVLSTALFDLYNDARTGPDALAFMYTLGLATLIGRSPERRLDRAARLRTARQLERIAEVFGVRMKRSLALPDPVSRAQLHAQLDVVAASIRSYQVDVAAPTQAGWPEIRRLTQQIMLTVCTGAVGAWPMRRATDATPGRSRLRAAVHVLRSIVVALLPLAVALPLNAAGYLEPAAFGRTVVTIALVWAVIGILAVMDPLLSSRLQATKDIMSVFKTDAAKK